MDFNDVLREVKELRGEKVLRTLGDRDEVVPTWLESMDTILEWAEELASGLAEIKDLIGDIVPSWLKALEPTAEQADEINEKVEEVKELMNELAECERLDMRDFQENVRTALDELLKLLGEP